MFRAQRKHHSQRDKVNACLSHLGRECVPEVGEDKMERNDHSSSHESCLIKRSLFFNRSAASD